MYYFEYPAYTSMLLREIRYGIDVGLATVSISPFGAPSSFEYHTGNVDVAYSSTKVLINVPSSSQSGTVTYNINGLQPNTSFSVMQPGLAPLTVQSGSSGLVSFSAYKAKQVLVLASSA
jgi:hypothetical protein